MSGTVISSHYASVAFRQARGLEEQVVRENALRLKEEESKELPQLNAKKAREHEADARTLAKRAKIQQLTAQAELAREKQPIRRLLLAARAVEMGLNSKESVTSEALEALSNSL